MRRFLVIRLSSIGDIVHALPAVAALGETYPDARIHWVVEARYASLLEGNPCVARLVPLDTLEWRKNLTLLQTIEDIFGALEALRGETFDAAIDFQGLTKSAAIASLSRSQERIGFAEKWLREPSAGVFYTQRVTPRGRTHVIEMNLALVERLGTRPIPRPLWRFPLPTSASEDGGVAKLLAQLDARDFIVIHPGAGRASKRWAAESYAELIRALEAELPWKMLLTGSREEEELIHRILAGAGCRRASYFPSTLLEYIALLRRARLFVGGDTGPMHLAAAVRVPVVAIFASDDRLNTPERNGPFSPDDVILSGVHRGANAGNAKPSSDLQAVSVESVLRGVRERLRRAYG